MRKSIRLTQRRQIPLSSLNVRLERSDTSNTVHLKLVNEKVFERFPGDASIKVRLQENKCSKTFCFGTLDDVKDRAMIERAMFYAPSCQLRVIASDRVGGGKVLGSTRKWTLRDKGNDVKSEQRIGILDVVEMPLGGRVWRLEIPGDANPILQIDNGLPSASVWAGSNPVFLSCVLPSVLQQILREIASGGEPNEGDWQMSWVEWIQQLAPGTKIPWGKRGDEFERWIEGLVDTFCQKHSLVKKLIAHIDGTSVQ